MRKIRNIGRHKDRLPGSFEELVRLMPPQAICDETDYQNTLEMVDRLMLVAKHTRGQSLYLETLIQLVQAYEAIEYPIKGHSTGLDTLKHLLADNDMTASDLAELLGEPSAIGTKILRAKHSLTVDQVRKLSAQFHVSPLLFMD